MRSEVAAEAVILAEAGTSEGLAAGAISEASAVISAECAALEEYTVSEDTGRALAVIVSSGDTASTGQRAGIRREAALREQIASAVSRETGLRPIGSRATRGRTVLRIAG
ncbi:MAG: hypothetical protein ACLPPF_16575 [Rhodomicrobium sp.]